MSDNKKKKFLVSITVERLYTCEVEAVTEEEAESLVDDLVDSYNTEYALEKLNAAEVVSGRECFVQTEYEVK